MKVAMGEYSGKLGTDHAPIFARFSARSQGDFVNAQVPRGPAVHSAPPPGPTVWTLSARKTSEYTKFLDDLDREPKLVCVNDARATYVTARGGRYWTQHRAANTLQITGIVTRDRVQTSLRKATVAGDSEELGSWRTLEVGRPMTRQLGRGTRRWRHALPRRKRWPGSLKDHRARAVPHR